MNSETDFNLLDSFRRNNSLLFNRNTKACFGDEKIEPLNGNEFTSWFQGFEKSFDVIQIHSDREGGEASPSRKEQSRKEEGFPELKNNQKESGFQFLASKNAVFSSEIRRSSEIRSRLPNGKTGFNFMKIIEAEDPISPSAKSCDEAPRILEQVSDNQNEIENDHPSQCKPRKYKTEMIKGLEIFLFKMFTQKSLSCKDFDLLKPQEEILQAILMRKFDKQMSVEQMSWNPQKKIDLINKFMNSTSKKRPEECYKFFLIRIIKYLKSKLTSQSPEQAHHDDDDELFYQFYFSETAKLKGLPLKDFFYPFNRKADKNAKLNAKYFEKLKMGTAFLEDAKGYLENEAKNEHAAEVQQKLFSLLKPHDQFIRKHKKTEEKCLLDLIEYIKENKHCKFPWTVKEQEESIEKFKGVIFDR